MLTADSEDRTGAPDAPGPNGQVMNSPTRFLGRMAVFVAIVVVVGALLFQPLHGAFLANPALNGLIGGVLVLGIVYVFRQVLVLRPAVEWIDSFREKGAGEDDSRPSLLAPMAAMLAERQGKLSLSAMSMRSVLDGIGARLDESREISRYLIGLLIFLGLLGTFWGLLETVSSIGDTIKSLTVTSDDFAAVFEDFKLGLEAPLSGMGTAFSSSLFGLAGSLVLGFLDLQASQAQNRFYNDLEDWLSTITRLSSGAAIGDGDQSIPAYVSALLEQTADTLNNLEGAFTRSEDSRGSVNTALTALSEGLAALTDQMHTEQRLMIKLAENQMELGPALERLATNLDKLSLAQGSGGLDEASRTHLRQIDVHLKSLAEDMAAGRDQMVKDLRAEIKLLTRTIAAVGERNR